MNTSRSKIILFILYISFFLLVLPKNGICQNSLLRFKDLDISTKNINGEIKASILVESQVYSDYTFIFTLYSMEQNLIFSKRRQYNILLGEQKAVFDLTVDSPVLWEPNNPYLYSLKIEAFRHDRKQFEFIQKFGIRTIRVKDSKILLNEVPVYLNGCGIENRDGQMPGTPELCRKMLGNIKSLGFNFIRHISHVPPDWYLNIADSAGILIQPELGTRINPGLLSYDNIIKSADDVRTKVYNLKRHPSVIIYCWGDEISFISQKEWHSVLYNEVKAIDSTRIILDNSGWGEFDRDNTDLLSQHFGFLFPYGDHKDVYKQYDMFLYNGSSEGIPEEELINSIRTGSFELNKPVIAHEVCSYSTFPDLRKKSIPEIESKIENNRLQAVMPKMVECSEKFVCISNKITIESIRISKMISGHVMYLLSDHPAELSGVLENSSFDIKQNFNPDFYKSFNNQTIVLADFEERIFYEGSEVPVKIYLSVFGKKTLPAGNIEWKLYQDESEFSKGRISNFQASEYGLNEAGNFTIQLPRLIIPQKVSLNVTFNCDNGIYSNEWDIWVFPRNRLVQQQGRRIDADLSFDVSRLYPFFNKPSLKRNQDLIVTRRFSPDLLDYLEEGGRVLFLYNPVIESPRYLYFPAVKSKFRPMVRSWGNNIGAIISDHPSIKNFPHEGHEDILFFNLFENGVKIILNTLPIDINPIIQPIDAPWSSRKFSFMFELKVGKGKILICSMNFSDMENEKPEVIYMFDQLLRYTLGDSFNPVNEIDRPTFENMTIGIGKYGAMFDFEAPWWEDDKVQKPKWDKLNKYKKDN